MVNLVAMESMQKLVIGMRTIKGFTLVEILVVLLIISLTIGFALLAFGDFGENRRVRIAAEQFYNYIQFIQQEAVVEGNVLGLLVTPHYYQALRFEEGQWKPFFLNKKVFSKQFFPDKTNIELQVMLRSPVLTLQGASHLLMYPTGDITPFKLTFSVSNTRVATLFTNSNGNLILQAEPLHD